MDRDNDVELQERETVYQGYFRMDRYRLRHRRHDGSWSRPLQREVLERGHAVAVLPYDAVRDRVVLIEQFRAGPYAHGGEPWQIEIVAGIIDAGETPEAVVRREAREEAGCVLGPELLRVASYYMSPGAVSEHMQVFVAATDSDGLGGVHGLDEEDEDIKVMVLPAGEAYEMVAAGRIANSPAIIALQWLQLNPGHATRLRMG
ncbi:MAG: NUDIX domain-containing protein [Pseudomonadota bacterium]|nr:NUDIX domain-containing protein [Pseudomonadota bacterium]